jgi:hypothetical protein
MDLVEVGLGGVDWIVESSCERSNEYSGFIKWWEAVEWLYNWQRLG